MNSPSTPAWAKSSARDQLAVVIYLVLELRGSQNVLTALPLYTPRSLRFTTYHELLRNRQAVCTLRVQRWRAFPYWRLVPELSDDQVFKSTGPNGLAALPPKVRCCISLRNSSVSTAVAHPCCEHVRHVTRLSLNTIVGADDSAGRRIAVVPATGSPQSSRSRSRGDS